MSARLRYAAATAGLLALLLTGCSGGGMGGGSNATAERAGASGGSAAEDTLEDAPQSRDAAERPGSKNRTTVQTRAVISTGRITVTSKDVDAARRQAEEIVADLDGYVSHEETSHDDEDTATSSRLVVRVPASVFADAMDAFEKLGKLEVSEQGAEDVTTELIDVSARVEALEASVERLEGFLRESANLENLIRLESEITARQAELDSLKSQQSYLEDQTSMSTIRLHMVTPPTYVEEPEALEDAGFLAGLSGGWTALKIFLVAVATMVGAVLPFAFAMLLVGVPVWLLVRAVARRRTAKVPEATGPGPEAPSE